MHPGPHAEMSMLCYGSGVSSSQSHFLEGPDDHSIGKTHGPNQASLRSFYVRRSAIIDAFAWSTLGPAQIGVADKCN